MTTDGPGGGAGGAGGAGGDGLLDVHLLGVPVQLWARASEHTDELMREFTLIAGELSEDDSRDGSREVPARLVALVGELTTDYGEFGAEQERRLAEAAEAGLASIDLEFRVPPAAADAVRHLGDLLDEADDYCRAGRHLLTLTTPPDQRAFRTWYLDQFVHQLAGAPPVPWPDRDAG